ncbi:MAG TPA: hypothetical protein PKL83_05660 [bacterium]|nr:hypothetical protein [bacterium]
MAENPLIRTGIIILGVIITVVSASADYTGIGQPWGTGFGYKQWAGTILGIICMMTGMILSRRRDSEG